MVSQTRLLLLLTTLTSSLFLTIAGYAADIVAHTDRLNVALDESFTLHLEVTGSVDDDPNFSPLTKDFEIVSNNQSSNINIVNGQMDRSTTWRLQLFPRRTGIIPIPSIAFGKDKSPELKVTVRKQTASKKLDVQEIFLEAEVSTKNPYVQQQVLFTTRLYRAIATNNDRLSDPTLGNQDAVISQLGDNRSYDKIINNIRYVIYERQFVIFPQREGPLSIPPIQYTATLGDSRGGFFSDPFGTRGKQVHHRTKGVTLDVQAIPAQYKGQHWLPASKVILSESWSPNPPKFTVGEPVTRSITLTAHGLTAAQLPELPAQTIDNFKLYPDQASLDDSSADNNVVGKRIDKVALIPTSPGQYTLPSMQIPWWNTSTQQQEYATLPAKTITVTGGSAATAPAATTPETSVNNTGATTSTPATQTSAGYWPWLTLLFAIAWLISLSLWWQQHKLIKQLNATTTEEPKRKLPDRKKVIRHLETACNNNDAEQAKQALLLWAQTQWPERATHNLTAIAEQTDNELAGQIQELNRILYKDQRLSWEGQKLWHAFKAWKPNQSDANTKKSPLAPLHQI